MIMQVAGILPDKQRIKYVEFPYNDMPILQRNDTEWSD